MTTAHIPPIDCSAFEAQLGDFLEGALSDEQRAAMESHRFKCAQCTTLLSELDGIVASAGAMPALRPSHDLWPGIEARINTPVVSLDGRVARAVAPRTFSIRTFAAAAIVLVTVSSGVTWMLARDREANTAGGAITNVAGNPTSAQPQSAVRGNSDTTSNAPTPPAAENETTATPTPVVASRDVEPAESGSTHARLASRGNADVSLIYEREIRAMRRVVDERLGDLDSTTVAEVERNLNIIDKAIEDSRRALARDPRSRFLSTQLDRALENKLSIMRRVALL